MAGRAVTGGAISTTGIAGLTLGGGLGWLMGAYGLGADNLIGVELVTADGTVRNVTDDSDPDRPPVRRGRGAAALLPENVFHPNHNIAPSSPRGRPAAQQDQ